MYVMPHDAGAGSMTSCIRQGRIAMRYTGNETIGFLDNVADSVPGPLGGVMPHRIAERLRTQIPDPWFVWNEFCPVGTHVGVSITAPCTVYLTGYTLDDAPQWMSLNSVVDGRQVRRDIAMQDLGRAVPDLVSRTLELRPGKPMRIDLDPAQSDDGNFTLTLSHTCLAEIIGIDSDEDVLPWHGPESRRRWTHYGSSISHSGQSVNPADRWMSQVARELDLRTRDFSLSGNAQLDQCLARAIANEPADFISCAVGINLVNADSMRERAFVPALHGFLDTIREGQPDTPLIMITACSCPMQENTPGPVICGADGVFNVVGRHVDYDEGALTLSRTRVLVEEALAKRADPKIGLIDGRSLLGEEDTGYLDDNLHPNQQGIDLIARRFAVALPEALAKLERQG
ncbi:GDSL-like lipase/acylhydrolase family protein [Bifidobacterium psychraerophilum DSM 22366]|nr:GDSL-like lipase/acylhydrolase family protein [Bifidobacterium psychraerophilum DSM 22366]